MSRLRELIDEFCPDGVEYKALGELFDIRNGYTPSKKNPAFWDDGVHPWFVMEDIRRDGTVLTESAAHITDAALKKNGLFPANSIIVATSATIGVHALVTVDFLCNQRFACMTIKQMYADKLDIRYVHQVFFALDRWCLEHVDQGNFATVNSAALRAYRIPVPPIEIQHEIVRILDSFQELDDALTAEIEAREKQLTNIRYELTADSAFDDSQLMPLSKVAAFSGGHTPSKAQLDNYAEGQNGVSWVTSKEVKQDVLGVSQITLTEKGASGLRRYPAGTTVMVTRSGILRHYLPIASLGVESTVNQDIRCICANDEAIDAYLFEVLKARADYMLRTFFNLGGTVDSINFNRVKSMVIPVPDKAKQKRIVDAIRPAEELLKALRLEREARRKQFAYYRDKLLAFPEVSKEAPA